MIESRAENAALAEQTHSESQFSLAGMMLFTTWSGVCLAALLARNVPALLALFTVVPAVLRTIRMVQELRQEGQPLNVRMVAFLYLASVGNLILCSCAAIGFTTFAAYAVYLTAALLGLSKSWHLLSWNVFPFVFYVLVARRSWSVRPMA